MPGRPRDPEGPQPPRHAPCRAPPGQGLGHQGGLPDPLHLRPAGRGSRGQAPRGLPLPRGPRDGRAGRVLQARPHPARRGRPGRGRGDPLTADRKLGLIAGSGDFPLLFAKEARRQNVSVLALALDGVTDRSLSTLVDEVRFFKLGQIDAPIKAFKSAGITQAVMAGKVQHSSLFSGFLPDWRAVKLLARLQDRRTDTILKAVADEFAKDGIELLSSATFLAHLLCEPGVLTKRRPDAAQKADFGLGWRAAKAVAGFDIGQTVAVLDGAVIAVEAMEGTDACVRRARSLLDGQGTKRPLVVVKVAKPRQDLRFDLPVLGLESLRVFAEANVGAAAIEAGSTLIFDKDAFLKQADEQGLALAALRNDGTF
ncbi:MAG: UDP-2,3-diacylglucosamine diphosphatase LpxI [Elusimicrobia bacterium]|nr:UDP-2,3-diacylglucosamine diphosphatase LpxI [Elusimicrobiota bacterium]